MDKIRSLKKYYLWATPIAIVIAIVCYFLCLLYSHHNFNADQFETFYALWDFAIAYLLEGIGLILFFILFLVSSNKAINTIKKIISISSFVIINIGILALVCTLIGNSIGLNRIINDYRLDCNLQSDNQTLFQQSVDAILPTCSYIRYTNQEPNKYIVKAARDGYAPAQNALGCFYHERGKLNLSSAEYEDNGSKHHAYIKSSESDFERSIFWFLKAAQNKYGVAQTNLGRIFMGDLASDRYPNITLAKQWLLKAVQNNDINAYYYLGLIYSDENLRDAYVYWSKGAELGNEDCARELEKPEFAMGMPEDKPIVEVAEIDSIPVSR